MANARARPVSRNVIAAVINATSTYSRMGTVTVAMRSACDLHLGAERLGHRRHADRTGPQHDGLVAGQVDDRGRDGFAGRPAVEIHRDVVTELLDGFRGRGGRAFPGTVGARSEEHTSELQSRENLVC